MSDEEKPAKPAGQLKNIGGSEDDTWNSHIANQISQLGCKVGLSDEDRKKQRFMLVAGAMAMKPEDEFEGMIIGQLIGLHNLSMEMMRRALIVDQPAPLVGECIAHANKLSRSYSTLLEALNRHRGKAGSQKIFVEYSSSFTHNQAVINNNGVGMPPKLEVQSYEPRAETFAGLTALRGEKKEVRAALSSESDGEWPLPNSRRNKPRRSKG